MLSPTILKLPIFPALQNYSTHKPSLSSMNLSKVVIQLNKECYSCFEVQITLYLIFLFANKKKNLRKNLSPLKYWQSYLSHSETRKGNTSSLTLNLIVVTPLHLFAAAQCWCAKI